MADARTGVIAAAAITALGGIVAAVITTRGGQSGHSSTPPVNSPASSFTVPGFSFPQEHSAEIFLSRDSGPGGSQVLVSGRGFGASDRVVIRFSTFQMGATTADAQGAFASVAVTIPGSFSVFAPQQFNIVATGQDSVRSASAPFTITG